MKAIRQVIAAALLLISMEGFGQVAVSATGGITSGSYTTLNAAFVAINTGAHQGAINISITGNTTEPSPPTSLIGSGVGSASYSSIYISPSGGSWTINSSALPYACRGIIELFGAQHVTIDGDPGHTGSRRLTFEMVRTFSPSTSVIRLASTDSTSGIHGAAYDTIINCNIIGGRDSINAAPLSYGILVSGPSVTSTITPASSGSNYLAFINNTFSRSRYAVYLNGSTAAVGSNGNMLLRKNVFSGSTPDTSNNNCIYIKHFCYSNVDPIGIIDSNDFSATGYFPFSCIYTYENVGAITVHDNNIHDVIGPSVVGYYFITPATYTTHPYVPVDFYNNTMQNCTATYVAANSISYLVGGNSYFASNVPHGDVHIYHNRVNNISGYNVTGIYAVGWTPTSSCYGNVITNITAINGTAIGLSGGGYNNIISGIHSAGPLSSSTGIKGGTTICNNMVSDITASPRSTSDSAHCATGINIQSAYFINSLVYNNTVALNTENDSASIPNGFSAAIYGVGANTTFKNNIIYNSQHSAYAYGFYESNTTFSETLDNNLYYTPYGSVGFSGVGTASDLSLWHSFTGGQDINSIYSDVPFVSTADVHIDTASPGAASVFRRALYFTTYPYDIDSQLRAYSPCIGADEFYSYGAGPDQAICQRGSVIMAATGTGTWSTTPGNPSPLLIADSSSAHSYVYGFVDTGIYRLIWTTGYMTDTVQIQVITAPDAGPDQYTTAPGYVTMAATGTGTWSLAASPGIIPVITDTASPHTTITLLNIAGTYICLWTNNEGCTDTVNVIVSAPPDSVWPGDADADHLVDNKDLLPIGLGFDSTGPVRTVQGIVWQADVASSWQDSFSIYAPTVNFKHADCNGDGITDAADTTAILTNFSLTHAKTNGYNSTWRSSTPALTVRLYRDTTYAGDTLTGKILLGDSAISVANIYGLAFTYYFDPIPVDTTSISFGFIPSWLGSSSNSINIHKDFSSGQIKAAITGIDHHNRSGDGQIATFRCIITTDNINGKDYMYYHNLAYISDITAIDAAGNPVQLNAGIDSNFVGFYPTGIRETSAAHISIYPNPAANQITISAGSGITSIVITDILGQSALAQAGSYRRVETITTTTLAAGVYIVHVSTTTGSGLSRLIINR